MNQVQMWEAEIQSLYRVLQQEERNAYDSENAAREAAEEWARGPAENVGIAPRVARPPAQRVGSPRLPQNASPRRRIDLRPPTDPVG